MNNEINFTTTAYTQAAEHSMRQHLIYQHLLTHTHIYETAQRRCRHSHRETPIIDGTEHYYKLEIRCLLELAINRVNTSECIKETRLP